MMPSIANDNPIYEVRVDLPNGQRVTIQKLEDDPLALRVSVGGDAIHGYYFTYRGPGPEIAGMMLAVAQAYEHYQREGAKLGWRT